MLKRLAIALALLAGVGAPSAHAAEEGFATARVTGSNGFDIAVSGFRHHVFVDAFNGTVGATYHAGGATMNGRGLLADLGEYGSVDLAFEQRGKTIRSSHPVGPCEFVSFRRRGVWTGIFEFEADAALTAVSVERLPGSIRRERFRCPELPARKGSGEGRSALLSAAGPGENPLFSALLLGHGKIQTSYFATAAGRRGPVDSDFYAGVAADTSTFTLQRDRATVTPPPPFSGTASFDRRGTPRWSGDLAVDLPVVGTTPLTGTAFKAGLRGGWFAVPGRRSWTRGPVPR